jgi:NAD+ synthase (glutamine-hydrolysing)
MTDFLRVAGAQIDLSVGDLDGNGDRIVEVIGWADEIGADVVLFPELAVTGYPPEDLLLREAFLTASIETLHRIAASTGDATAVVGFVDRGYASARDDAGPTRLHNAAALLQGGRLRGVYHKCLLPNYGVFDEDRYFVAGRSPGALWEINGVVVGVSICEDIWVADGPHAAQAQGGADILLNINGSPFHRGKGGERAAMLAERARATGLPIVYLNMIGSQDELVFDGQSMAFDAAGALLYRGPQFAEDLFWLDVPLSESGRAGVEATVVSTGDLLEGEPEPLPSSHPPLDDLAEVYAALTHGLEGYVRKNGFNGVVIGLSGGIDSALTAAVAADALGTDRVWGVAMPSRHSSEGSITDARALADSLGIRFDVVSIEPPYTGYLETLEPLFAGREPGIAHENLQARIRGAILMALSNEFGGMLLTTGNKSEMSVGYATLYGDMAGGFSVLKDVYKTLVWDLARWRNRDGEVIPQASIDKPPSAELRDDQFDTDSLPAYAELDPILGRYIEGDASVRSIVADGFDADLVARIARMVDANEYKRRQAAPGVRITTKGLGRDRRLPITNHFQG